jgi:hypothetical protein
MPVFASEIGLGFSPHMQTAHEPGADESFQPTSIGFVTQHVPRSVAFVCFRSTSTKLAL